MSNQSTFVHWMSLIPRESAVKAGELLARVSNETKQGAKILPPQKDIFRALHETAPEDVKVVIVGQDPYHTPGVANGLAFSVSSSENKLQPPLREIFQELVNDVKCAKPKSGDLTEWAHRGILLLNTTLTVYEHQPNSCANWGWSAITSELLKATAQLPQPIVYLLWGSNAQALKHEIVETAAALERPGSVLLDQEHKKAIIMSSHPNPLGATRTCGKTPAFIGSRPFTRANRLLQEMGAEPVDWSLPHN